MIKQVKEKKSNPSLIKTLKNTLSIQFSLDGFSFCISDLDSKEILYFSDYTFENTLNSPENLLEKIKSIFNEDPMLHKEYKEVFVIHQNSLNTLVPDIFFEEKSIASYLRYSIKTLQNDFITFDTISEINTKNVYVPYVNINNYLFQNFGEFEYKHHTTVLLEKLLKSNHSEEKSMFVNVYENTFDVVVLEHKKPLFSNCFSYQTKEDFIYYILYVAEQLQLNTEEFNLYFMGAIDLQSSLYSIAFKYIKNIYFLESNSAIFKNLEANKHSYYLLLG